MILTAIATLARVIPRAPLLVRLWWSAPRGPAREDVALVLAPGPRQLSIAGLESVDGVSAQRWRSAQLFCGWGEDALAIETSDEATREFLENELLDRRAERDTRFFDHIKAFADHGFVGTPCYLELVFVAREGVTHFDRLRWLEPERVRRRGSDYAVRGQDGSSRNVPAERVLDAERDLAGAGLTGEEREILIREYLSDRIRDQERLATSEAYATPELHGLRWDAARLRGLDLRRTYVASARQTQVLAGSLIERRLYYADKPPFTDHFLRWQLRECLHRIAALRGAVLAMLDTRVVAPLVERNKLAPARLIVAGAVPLERVDAAYSEAEENHLEPFAFYQRAVWSPTVSG